MSDVVISVEHLAKCYQARNGGAERERYTALRDVLARQATAPLKWLKAQVRKTQQDDGNASTRFRSSPSALHSRRLKLARPASEFWALKDVTFEVNRGDVVGIVGRNGAGKSTLLKIVSRITAPTSGRVRIKGRVVSLLEVGTGFHPELSGKENIFLNGAIMGMAKAEIRKKFDEIVEFAEVANFLDTPIKHYSSGMYMRLAFAVAAHLDADIMIVDEVLAVGDASFQRKCLGKMGEVARSGRTILFVSHNMSAIQQLCSSAALLRGGVLEMNGLVEPILHEYLRDALNNNTGVFNVAEHQARPRSLTPAIQRIVLSDAAGLRRTTFRPQDTLTITMHLTLVCPVRDPMIAVAIEDSLGRRITTMANYFSPGQFSELVGDVNVRCSLKQIGLGSGRYLISASIGDRLGSQIDSIDGIAWFSVEWDNNYGNGEPYRPVYGPVLSASVWQVLTAESVNSHEDSLPIA